MKILLINSDLAKNRGDRAITEGVVQLIRENWPNAKITGISEYPERDSEWFGIDFIDMDIHSLNPFDLLKLLIKAKKSDLVFWGGGELLKDYTNKASLWYWTGKIWLLSLVNKKIYGTFQGIGPTSSSLSKKLIKFTVERCRLFSVRDEQSLEKLLSWGCSPERVILGSDPAMLPRPTDPAKRLLKKIDNQYDIDSKFLNNFIAVGPREWFHYHHGGIIPYQYRKKLGLKKTTKLDDSTKDHATYRQSLVQLSRVVLEQGYNLLLVPMHMDEEDIELCRHIKDNASRPEMVRVLDQDNLSPKELRDILCKAQVMVGFRLHTTIIAISGYVPSITYYYVDKGRAYFEQIKQQGFAFPIEATLQDDFSNSFRNNLLKLINESGSIKSSLQSRIPELRHSARKAFKSLRSHFEEG